VVNEAHLKAQADVQAAKAAFFALECTGVSGWLFRWWSASQSLSVGL
jgi:hypothetical protein